MSFSTGVTVLIYGIFIITAIYAFKMEFTDLRCPSVGSKFCAPGRGVAYFQGRPTNNDSVPVLLDKISLSSSYESNSVKWRRCLIISLVITFVLFLLVFSRLPTGQELLIFLLIIYMSLYFMLSYYQNQVSKPAVKQIDVAVKLIRQHLRI